MITRARVVLAAVAMAALLGSGQNAFAWSCAAVASDGTYGYSYNYDNRGDAEDRALDECVERTGETCEIAECDSNG